MSASKKITADEEASLQPDPVFSSPARGQMEADLEQLKERLLKPFLETINQTSLVREIFWAANEAAALAWFTVCPILILPTLLEEKVHEALKKWDKRQDVRRR